MGKRYTTTNYSMFKYLGGNRELYEPNVKKLMESISITGYIGVPIIVNENHEVIDGQHRLEALKRLGLAVPYEVRNGYSLKEMQTLNEAQKQWSVKDTILSEAKLNNKCYVWLENLYESFPTLGYNRLAAICKKTYSDGKITKALKGRRFVITYEEYAQAIKCCEWILLIDPILDKYNGRKQIAYDGLIWCYYNDEIDNDILLKKIQTHFLAVIPRLSKKHDFIRDIEKVYNYKNKKTKYLPIYEMYASELRDKKKN